MPESKQELKERIGDLAYRVTQEAATERPFTGTYNDFFEEGLYVDIVSGEALFSSKDKFRSGCGWPAFSQPITADKISRHDDYSYLNIPRVEVKSQQAQSHLGHVFLDGPKDRGGLRYCINSAALDFIPKDQLVQRGYGDYLELFEEDK